MTKRLLFTVVWMAVGFISAAIISLLIAPLVPRPPAEDEHTPAVMIFIYIGFALLPLVGIGIPLILGLLGKLPGTKKDRSYDHA
jgi:hypothetical protein